MVRPRYLSWILQAESDLRTVDFLTKGGHYAQGCFNAQQAAEKALKALAFFRGVLMVKSHSLKTIASDLKINGVLETYSSKLDLYYLSARYPDALPDYAVPAENFTRDMATEAYTMAAEFLKTVKSEIEK